MTSNLTTGRIIRCVLLFFLITCYAIIGCSLLPTRFNDNKAYTKYVERFAQYCVLYKKDCSRLKTLRIGFAQIDPLVKITTPNSIATCEYLNNEVILSEEYWNRVTIADRESTVFHELGHCIFNKNHHDTELDIMNTITFHNSSYILLYQELQNKLFDCVSNCPVVNFDRSFYAD